MKVFFIQRFDAPEVLRNGTDFIEVGEETTLGIIKWSVTKKL